MGDMGSIMSKLKEGGDGKKGGFPNPFGDMGNFM